MTAKHVASGKTVQQGKFTHWIARYQSQRVLSELGYSFGEPSQVEADMFLIIAKAFSDVAAQKIKKRK